MRQCLSGGKQNIRHPFLFHLDTMYIPIYQMPVVPGHILRSLLWRGGVLDGILCVSASSIATLLFTTDSYVSCFYLLCCSSLCPLLHLKNSPLKASPFYLHPDCTMSALTLTTLVFHRFCSQCIYKIMIENRSLVVQSKQYQLQNT